MQRFDEMELRCGLPAEIPHPLLQLETSPAAPRGRRLLALLTDLSLFLALALAVSPLLPATRDAMAIAGLCGFVVLVSYYYFVGSWLLWGKTVGGAIFDVRVAPTSDGAMSLQSATLRWTGILLSLLTGGIGFAAAVPDRMSATHSISA